MSIPFSPDARLTADEAIHWIAYRGGQTAPGEGIAPGSQPPPDDGYREWYDAERALVVAAAEGRIRVWGIEGGEDAPAPRAPADLVPAVVFQFAGIGFRPLDNTIGIKPSHPRDAALEAILSYRGPSFHKISISAGDVLKMWPAAY